jgi:predicted dehydrogenase
MTINVAILGMGFMGRTHLRAYTAAAGDGLPCRIAAIASEGPLDLGGSIAARDNLDRTPEGPQIDPSQVRIHPDAHSLAHDPHIDLVSICTPTDTHIPLAAMMLRAGKHVLLEKPVALRAAEVLQLAAIASSAGRLCMPAMCMRFWPGWDWLKARIADRAFGAVRSASFTRLGSRPAWSPEFYRDPARCGGALFDLHVHDADIVCWLFGPPRSSISRGTIDHVTTSFQFDDGPPHVAAEGGWLESPGFPFRMRYTVEFERAIADWDLSRTSPLHITRDGQTRPEPLPSGAGYDGEVRAMLRAVATGDLAGCPTLEEAAAVIALLESARTTLTT